MRRLCVFHQRLDALDVFGGGHAVGLLEGLGKVVDRAEAAFLDAKKSACDSRRTPKSAVAVYQMFKKAAFYQKAEKGSCATV